MKYPIFSRNIAILVVSTSGLTVLCGCASLAEWFATPEGQVVVQKSSDGLGKVLSGDISGAAGQVIDIALILLGLKGAVKGGKAVGTIVKNRVLNPKNDVTAATVAPAAPPAA